MDAWVNTLAVISIVAGLSANICLAMLERYRMSMVFAIIQCVCITHNAWIASSSAMVWLNVTWACLSLWGLLRGAPPEAAVEEKASLSLWHVGLSALGTVGIAVLLMGLHEWAAWCTSIIYVVGFSAMIRHRLSKEAYLWFCLWGFTLLPHHLLVTGLYEVLVVEVVVAGICLFGAVKLRRRRLSNVCSKVDFA